MKILLTGATGLVGAHTAMELLRHGHQLRLLVRNRQAAETYFSRHGFMVDDIVVADMTDSTLVRQALLGCDAVVHAAASVDLNASHAAQTQSLNVSGLENVVGQACELGISRILYVSSVSAVFQPDMNHLDESAPIASTRDAYSRSKELCEIRVRQWQAQGRPIIVTYPVGVFGPDDPKLAQSNEGLLTMVNDMVPLTSSGMQFVDVRDLAIAHRLLLERDQLATPATDDRYLVAGFYMPWRRFADLLDQALGRPVRRVPCPGFLLRLAGRILDVLRYWLPIHFPLSHEAALIVTRFPHVDSGRLLQTTGMTFRDPLETLADTLGWLREQGHIKHSEDKHGKRRNHPPSGGQGG